MNPIFEPELHEIMEEDRAKAKSRSKYRRKREPSPRQISIDNRIIEFYPMMPCRTLQDMTEEEIQAIEAREGLPVQRPEPVLQVVEHEDRVDAVNAFFQAAAADNPDHARLLSSLVEPDDLDSACTQKTSMLPCKSEPEHGTETEPGTETDPDLEPET